jgi:hypothetical protein
MGLRHASFAEAERVLFIRTSAVEQVSGWCVEVLGAAGLRCATLKGPALAMQLYGDDVIRPSSDVDVLVAQRELERALEVLRAAGLRFGTRHAAWYERRWHHHLVAVGAPTHPGLPVEVHWSFARPGLIAGSLGGSSTTSFRWNAPDDACRRRAWSGSCSSAPCTQPSTTSRRARFSTSP